MKKIKFRLRIGRNKDFKYLNIFLFVVVVEAVAAPPLIDLLQSFVVVISGLAVHVCRMSILEVQLASVSLSSNKRTYLFFPLW